MALACGGTPSLTPDPALASLDVPSMGDPDELLVVDCLLPAKVKKLGSEMTYLAPRRAVKTSAVDCEIRGGEYVAYDRADYRTALQVWLPLAERGDAKAQTYVGEIYEKGLGLAPDHARAADWYRKAAEQGYAPAQINLGQLYERGLGVEKDVDTALAWYRKASGLPDLGLEYVAFRNDAQARQRLEARLARSQGELEALRRELVRTQRALSEARSLQREAEHLDPGDERAALREEAETLARERRELERERERLRASAPDPEAGRAGTAALDRRAREIAAREQAVAERERALDARRDELAGLEEKIRRLEQQAEESREKVLALARSESASEPAAIPGPTIQLVDPSIVKTRSRGSDDDTVTVPVSGRERLVAGRVEAPAGLLTLMINDVEAQVSPDGLFETRVRIRRGVTPVSVVAVDRQGKRSDRRFLLRPTGLGEVPSAAPEPAPEPVPEATDFGRYYALVIGNQSYERLPDLDTARADAQAVAALLKERYGFTVIPRYDATRYEILYILNELRSRLTESDNLVIYYAGHGELDAANQRGHWLPVDADPDNRTNWISNVQITDILNAMEAKHALVIADSCYSGALTGTAVAQIDPEAPPGERRAWQRAISRKRSRTTLTSGGVKPVLDGGGGGHSVFAKALLTVLSQNTSVLEGWRLHQEVAARVTWAAKRQQFEQEPRYAPIRHAGHEAGDFLLVPTTS